MIVLAPDFMTKICKKAAQHFHCAVSKVFDRVKSVALWSANIRKLAKDHKGYGSAATLRSKGVKIDWLEIGENVPECSDMATCRLLFIFSELELLKSNKACWYSTKRRHFIEGNLFSPRHTYMYIVAANCSFGIDQQSFSH